MPILGLSGLIGGRDPFATTTGDSVRFLKTGRIAPFVRNGEVRRYGFRRPHAREDVAAGDAVGFLLYRRGGVM